VGSGRYDEHLEVSIGASERRWRSEEETIKGLKPAMLCYKGTHTPSTGYERDQVIDEALARFLRSPLTKRQRIHILLRSGAFNYHVKLVLSGNEVLFSFHSEAMDWWLPSSTFLLSNKQR